MISALKILAVAALWYINTNAFYNMLNFSKFELTEAPATNFLNI